MYNHITRWMMGPAGSGLLAGLPAVAAEAPAEATTPTARISLFTGTNVCSQQ